jgi:hypothetical protein
MSIASSSQARGVPTLNVLASSHAVSGVSGSGKCISSRNHVCSASSGSFQVTGNGGALGTVIEPPWLEGR